MRDVLRSLEQAIHEVRGDETAELVYRDRTALAGGMRGSDSLIRAAHRIHNSRIYGRQNRKGGNYAVRPADFASCQANLVPLSAHAPNF